MSGFPIIDLVVGVIFIFFLLSVICSSAVELLFSIRRTRAKLLEQWLKKIFDSKALDSDGKPTNITVGQAIMDHCMVTALSEKDKSPSYINAKSFVAALLDKITIQKLPDASKVQLPPADLSGYILAIENSEVISGELKRTILAFAHQARAASSALLAIPPVANLSATITGEIKSDLEIFIKKLETWYDNNAERLTAAMKRKKAMPTTVIIALIMTIAMNADSVDIIKYFYAHPEVSKEVAQTAFANIEKTSKKVDTLSKKGGSQPNDLEKQTKLLRAEVNTLLAALPSSVPFGYKDEGYNWKNESVKSLYMLLKRHLVGWLLTILAISIGAPFWFDILNKIANLRGSGPKPASTAEEKK